MHIIIEDFKYFGWRRCLLTLNNSSFLPVEGYNVWWKKKRGKLRQQTLVFDLASPNIAASISMATKHKPPLCGEILMLAQSLKKKEKKMLKKENLI